MIIVIGRLDDEHRNMQETDVKQANKSNCENFLYVSSNYYPNF